MSGTVLTAGIDLGGTNVRIALVDADGRIVGDVSRPRPLGAGELVASMAGSIEELERLHGPADAVGIGAAGLVGPGGFVHYAANIAELVETPLRDLANGAIGKPVLVDNDANVAALAEMTYGAVRSVSDALVVTIGTGVGGGVICNGALVRGAHGFAAEIGHWQVVEDGPRCACGEYGHWEAIASGTALGRMGRERAAWDAAPGLLDRAGGAIDAITGELVGAAAQDGDDDALAILHDFADHVALGFAGLANIFDPAVIAVSGGLARLGPVFLDPVRAAFGHRLEGAEFRPEVPIVPAALGAEAGVVGAAILARAAR